MEGNRSGDRVAGGRGAVRSGVLTGVSTAAVSGSAAVLGIILSRKFGHGVKTDGFFAAYGPYLALVLVAGSLRVIVLPRFVDARSTGRLGREVSTWAAGLAPALAALVLAVVLWPHEIASALSSSPSARDQAAQLLPWVVASAVAQILAGMAASALAALDDYDWAAFGFAVGSVVGVLMTILFVGHGVIAFGWGLAVNGAVTLGVPLVALLWRSGVGRPDGWGWSRLLVLGEGVALPLALQVLYVIALRFASGLGTGRGTTFSFAYLIAAFLVAITATSIALVATVPFARAGATSDRVTRHVVAASWISLALVAAAAGFFALAGEAVVRRVLGASYAGGTGAELGRLVVYLAPWMVASVAVTVAYPLLFVQGRTRWLPGLAAAALAFHVLLEWVLQSAFGLPGVAVGLGVTTALVLVAILHALRAVRRTAHGVALAAVVCGGLATAVYGLPRLVLDPLPAAVLGIVAYVAVLGVWRPRGLRDAWAYVRALQ
jgi:O-antigen/teichoic acid export membrane protein